MADAEMVPDFILAPYFIGPQEIWATMTLVSQKHGPQEIWSSIKKCHLMIFVQEPNFFGTKYVEKRSKQQKIL